MTKPDLTLTELTKILGKEGIEVIAQQNAQGMLYGITYLDHRSRCVFKGSDLGKAYSAKAIAKRCGQSFFQKGSRLPALLTQKPSFVLWRKEQIRLSHGSKASLQSLVFNPAWVTAVPVTATRKEDPLIALMQTEPAIDYVPNALRKAKRKRKKRKSNHSPEN